MNTLKKHKLILASGSPRRSEILRTSHIPFEKKVVEVEEIYPESLSAHKVPEFLASLKAEPFLETLEEDEIVLTADTIVLYDNRILGKPKSKEEAEGILKLLSGKSHEVITGFCLTSTAKTVSRSCSSIVYFADMSQEEINYYINTCNPMDKAGSYGIQEWIGYCKIIKIDGSYLNIMGLPMQMVYEELKSWE